jgi:hypothetical protein
MNALDGTTERALCVGDVVGTGVFTAVADANAVASGGVFSAPPYAVLYGNDGKVTWSNANEPQNYTTGDAGTARVTGSKIVKGLSISSGSGPAGLLWSLDSVINMNFVGGAAIFRFTTVSRQSSIMSPGSVIEYDGTYFWIGNDRFLMTNGEQVSEVPNNMNFNWFFDHVNRDHSSKVWGMKIPRYGEIWWFYPRDDATECTNAIIFNVREKIWYDVELNRSAGYHQQVFNYPVMANSVKSFNRSLTITINSGTIAVGDTVTGGTSKATGYVMSILSATSIIVQLTSSIEFIDDEELTLTSSVSTLNAQTNLYSIYIHEKGSKSIEEEIESNIPTWLISSDIGLPTGGVVNQNDKDGINRWTRLVRVEPDFLMNGSLTLEILGREFVSSDEVVSGPFAFTQEDAKIDLRVQHRHIRLKFTAGPDCDYFEMGRIILHTEPGDIRS